MSFIRIDGVLLHYRVTGPTSAKPLVLVNSLGTDARIWDAVIEQLALNYRVVSYDKRGHGLSDTPPGEYSLDHHLLDLLGLADHLGLAQFALAGVSIGGLIAQGTALRAPDRLAALIICNSAPKVGDTAMWASRIATVREHGMAAIADGIMERWFSQGFRAGKPDELAGWRNMFLRADTQGYAATCATLRDTDLSAEINAIACPTLVVGGTEDLATPLPLVEACARAVPGALFEVFSGTGHIPSIEQPAKLAALMQHFLQEAGHG